MDKKDLEKKLRSLEIPPPDEAKKKLILQAAMEEFEKSSNMSKGIETERRPKSKKGSFFPLKGGSLMTRPMFATISLAFVALFLIFGIMNYPGLTSRKSEFTQTTPQTIHRGVEDGGSASKSLNEPTSKIAGKAKGEESSVKSRIIKPADKPMSRQLVFQDKKNQIGDRRRDESDVRVLGAVVSEEITSLEAKTPAYPALMKSDQDIYFDKSMSKKEARIAGSERGNLSLMRAKPSKMKAKGYSGGLVILREAERAYIPANIPNEYAGRDRFESFKENRVKLVSEAPVSTFSLDVDTTSYSFMRRALHNGHLPQKDAVRIEELINYFDYDYSLPQSKTVPFRPTIAIYPTPWNKNTKLIHIGIKGHDIIKSERPRANLVFLLDVSGSMRSPDKLPLLKNSMKMLITELSPEDTVAIVVYAGAAGTVLEPTKVSEKGKILAALERLQAGGSTAGGAGIKLAYSLAEANFNSNAVNRVILATDGDFNVGIRDTNELKGFIERKRETGVFLTVLGFGQGNYNDQLMQTLAQNGNGNAAYIDTLSEARKVLVDEASSTLFTIAKDVKIQIEFNPDRVSDYRLIGYESRMLNREDFNNDKVDAGDVGAGASVTAIYEITPVDSKNNLIDPLRYSKESPKPKTDPSSEYAFLKIRYKLPNETKSRLITTPITDELEFKELSSAPTEVRFAASVAAFGQLLKGGSFIGGFTYNDVRELAEGSRGRDRFGYRSEFLSLIGLAETASTMGER